MKVPGTVTKLLLAVLPIVAACSLSGADRPAVQVAAMDGVGPRSVEKQTQVSVVRDYLLAWQTLGEATEHNQPALLEGYFVGTAKEKLAATVREQQNLGLQTACRSQTHNIKVVFYSPEGLSIQLVDNVECDMEVRDHEKTVGTRHVRSRYLVVLTPAESSWKVRVFQGGS